MSKENISKPDTNRPDTPYKGLAPYSEDDASFFFGRENEWKIIADNLMAARLTLLYGVSGVGKSSLLRAGVAYNLMKAAKKNLAEYGVPEFAVVVFNAWQNDPLADLVKQVEKDIMKLLDGKTFAPLSSLLKLDQILEIWAERLDENEGGELLIILDQFEEYFLYHPNEQGVGTFATEFPRAVNCFDLPVNFLIAIREDSLAKLDRFKASIPNLFDNYLRVKHLDAKSAYDAISKPIDVYNDLLPHKEPIKINEGLVRVVIDQVSQVVKGTNGLGITKESRVELEKKIELPYLQLVMQYLWKKEIENEGKNSLDLKTLVDMGDAKTIVSAHLNQQMKLLRKEEGEASVAAVAKIFQYLVTPSGSKIAYPLKDLIKPTGYSEKQLRSLLYKLTSEQYRLLREISKSPDSDVERYEIFHDVLAQPILDWRKDYLVNEEKYRRNLAIKEGLPAQSLRQLKLGRHQRATLLARQAYCFYQREPNKVLYQIDEALREALCISNFNNFLRGHKKGLSGISAVAFNPKNPQMLVFADYQGNILLWDLRRQYDVSQARKVKDFPKIVNNVNALAFSPDGKMLASGGLDGKVYLWRDLTNLDDHKKLGHHNKSVASLAFNWNGTILASGNNDKTIKLWNTENQSETKPIATLAGHGNAVRAVAFSPDQETGYLLASGSKDERIRLWDIRHNSCLQVLEGHSKVVRSVAFNPKNSQMLASGSEDKTVIIWDLSNLKEIVEIKSLTEHKNGVRSVAFSSDGKWLASGSEDQTLYLWKLDPFDQKNILLKEKLRGHNFGISAVAFSPDNQILASGSWDNTIRLWHLYPSKANPQILGKHQDNIMSVAVSQDGRWLASASWDKTVRLWNLRKPNAQLEVIGKHEDKVFAVAFDQNSQMLASAGADKIIKLWRNLQNPEEVPQELIGHKDGVSSVAFSPDGRWLVSGSWKKDATVRLWDLEHPDATGQIVGKILWQHKNLKTEKSESVTSVAFSLDGQMIASGSDDATIKLLDLRRTEGLSWDSIYEKSSSYSPENSVVDPVILNGHKARVWSVAFSPNSKMLASGSDDRTIRLWDLSQTEAEPKVLEDHNFWVGSVAFSPDGQKLASGSYDKTIRLWDLNHLDENPIVLRGHEQSITSVAFYLDGKKLVSGSYDNTIRSWIVDTEILADMVCEKVQRNLSKKEWKWFMGHDILYERTCPNLPPGEEIEEIAKAEEESELEREFRVKCEQFKLYPGQKYVLEFIKRKTAQQLDISEEDVTNFLHKPKGDLETFYRLETLRFLGFLEKIGKGDEPGTIRYSLSPRYREYLSTRLGRLAYLSTTETTQSRKNSTFVRSLKSLHRKDLRETFQVVLSRTKSNLGFA